MLVWHHNPHGKRAMHRDYASTFESVDQPSPGWSRSQVAELVLQFAASHSSHRAFAQRVNIPRSPLPHWLKRKHTLDADPALVAFFSSPAGSALLPPIP